MNFELTPEQRRWQELARDFARRVLGPGADAWDEAGECPLAAFREAATLGLAGLFAPVADGGQDLARAEAGARYRDGSRSETSQTRRVSPG